MEKIILFYIPLWPITKLSNIYYKQNLNQNTWMCVVAPHCTIRPKKNFLTARTSMLFTRIIAVVIIIGIYISADDTVIGHWRINLK